MNRRNLVGRTVLVSGAAGGLGEALCRRFSHLGANIVALDHDETRLHALAGALRDAGRVLAVPADVTDAAACQQAVASALAEYGHLDVLVNNAGISHRSLLVDTDPAVIRRVMEVNFFGTMQLTQACVPAMIAAGGGAIVMIGTMVEHKPLATQGGYGASKSALRSATKHLALELGQHGIRVNSCHMGWMWGPAVEGYLAWQASESGRSLEEHIAEVTRNIPLGIIPDDGECAKAAVLLASDYASVVTGAALDVNGGEYMPV